MRESYRCEKHPVEQPAEGTVWIEDGVLHVRDSLYRYEAEGDPLCEGTLEIGVNLNFDFATWSGVLWGKTTAELDAFDGGYTATWNAHWTTSDPLAPDAEDIWAGRYVGHGTGALEGCHFRSALVEEKHTLVIDEGYAFCPGA